LIYSYCHTNARINEQSLAGGFFAAQREKVTDNLCPLDALG
jgi:hypothetical protein